MTKSRSCALGMEQCARMCSSPPGDEHGRIQIGPRNGNFSVLARRRRGVTKPYEGKKRKGKKRRKEKRRGEKKKSVWERKVRNFEVHYNTMNQTDCMYEHERQRRS